MRMIQSKMDLYGFILIDIDLCRFIYVLYASASVLYEFRLVHTVYVHLYVCVYISGGFISLVWPVSLPQALFFRPKDAFPVFWNMSILEIVRIV